MPVIFANFPGAGFALQIEPDIGIRIGAEVLVSGGHAHAVVVLVGGRASAGDAIAVASAAKITRVFISSLHF